MRLYSIVLMVILIYGCSGVKEAQKSKDHPNCFSVVEAFYTTDTTYTTKPPLLLLKTAEYSNDTRRLYGSIVSINDTGVVFQRSKKPKFYPYENIECLIDSNNRIAYGEWKNAPEVVWDVELICKRIDIPNSEPFSLILEANRVSSYCIGAGEYKILYIKFSSSDEYLDQSDSLNFSRFNIPKNAITFLGTFHSEYKRNLTSGVNPIPTNIIRRKSMGFAGGYMFGAVGGLVGALADEENLNREKRLACLHGLSVSIDSSYKPTFKGNLPLILSPIIIEDKQPNQQLKLTK